ncbi:FAD-binding oxidoreductase [Cyanobacterium stanieri LEGE 03274]|uniref:FAD-binding oxidoreductase n=1 Tax=Cyanobacterium stanieri LEGE 03274 TaxID=1828756 RepID=A0ABR9V104_9CHRO|nr:FAD-dependent oxidoreductase [Cyanobacterium stanieri]MBE9221555.1 FAD-binding oxidoreductase [Cyanobacterium stanieri LEGE 03274]
MKKIVIIGAGVVGSAIAFELSQDAQLDITLIDEKEPAQGSTGGALGLLMGVMSQKIKGRAWRLRENSLKRYKTLLPELEALTGLNIPYNRHGIVKLLFSSDNLDKWHTLAEKRAEQGYSLEVWNRAKLQSICPEVQGEEIIGAVSSMDDLQINPIPLTQALALGARRRGVKCIFGQKVDNFILKTQDSEEKKVCEGLSVGGKPLGADLVIISAGLGSTPLTEKLNQGVEIKPVLGQAMVLHSQSWKHRADFNPVITGDDVHIVPLEGNRFWVGATLEFANEDGIVIEDKQLMANLYQRAIAFCPALKSASIISQWSGKRPRPQGRPAPIIEWLEGYDNVILATAHYRNGILLAPATAMEVRELIMNV